MVFQAKETPVQWPGNNKSRAADRECSMVQLALARRQQEVHWASSGQCTSMVTLKAELKCSELIL